MDPSSYSSMSSDLTLMATADATHHADLFHAVRDTIEEAARQTKDLSPMDATFHRQAAKAVSTLIDKHATGQSRVVVAVAGTPGAGKTTLAKRVSEIINEAYTAVLKQVAAEDNTNSLYKYSNSSASTLASSTGSAYNEPPEPRADGKSTTANLEFATTVPLDGFHLTRAELDRFADPVAAHHRRGAPWTFDAAAAVRKTRELRATCFPSTSTNTQAGQVLYFPAFDHAVKDPQPDAIAVLPAAKIVIIEGLYTLLDQDPWCEIASLVELRWFIDVPLSVTRTRLARRHVAAGIVKTLAEGEARVDTNDSLNAVLIKENLIPQVQHGDKTEQVEILCGES